MTTSLFSNLNLPAAALTNLAQMGYEQMTPIQQQSLPLVLSGRDLIAQAQTGSGKTAAFGIGMLETLNPRLFAVQGLVLCPTRELAGQVAGELRKLARYLDNIKIITLCGGQPIGPQIGSLEHGAHIVVGTPGRLRDHLRKETLKLDRLSMLVLDEADRMLDMGFEEDIRFIIGATPAKRQTLLFSATYPEQIESISAAYQYDPVRVSIDTQHDDSTIEQKVWYCDSKHKAAAVAAVLQHFAPEAAIIFCNTKQGCNDMANALRDYDLKSLSLHGDLEQRERDQVLIRFSNGSSRYLLATDVAARGLDIDAVDLVINADLPQDPAVYTHRVGRTGRAGRKGIAICLCGERDKHRLQRIEALQSQPIIAIDNLPTATPDRNPAPAEMTTLCIAGGRKDKLRAGDILGALTRAGGIDAKQIGKIDITDHACYVAVHRRIAADALEQLKLGKIKGRTFRARRI
ncbi:ATP-dependent RNA helicase DbpA [Nitrincola iocasae]|uniref:DEAD-box ATP-dependent RNA helicase RhpA n=1 Tax=Nitrincola iocasae TaxID=2614693 RepID=A0A5J6LHL0_9GAMM|nr:ATP-dependent RNA helicase DbpA [Nitrincola iocasae]QEW07978.1 ATP-dependent RNA helicase DbpA [Nitrincola iocasae]